MIVYILGSNTAIALTMPSAVYSSVAAKDVDVIAVVVPLESPPIAVALLAAEADLKADGNIVSGSLLIQGGSFTNADLPEVIVEEVDSGEEKGEEVIESG